MTDLKKQLIRLGYQKPGLRNDIRPVLDSITGRTSKSAADMKPVFKQVTDYSDQLADKAQTELRKHPELTAHRTKPGEGMERVTIKKDNTKACLCFGVDASDIHNIKHVCIVKIDGEKVKRKSLAPELGEDELVAKGTDLLLKQLGLSKTASRNRRSSRMTEYIIEDVMGNVASIVLRDDQNPLQEKNPLTGYKVRHIIVDIDPPGQYSELVPGPFGETAPVDRGTEPLEAPHRE